MTAETLPSGIVKLEVRERHLISSGCKMMATWSSMMLVIAPSGHLRLMAKEKAAGRPSSRMTVDS
jgi:hypothetical protein